MQQKEKEYGIQVPRRQKERGLIVSEGRTVREEKREE
jgi:hypothetical protein